MFMIISEMILHIEALDRLQKMNMLNIKSI